MVVVQSGLGMAGDANVTLHFDGTLNGGAFHVRALDVESPRGSGFSGVRVFRSLARETPLRKFVLHTVCVFAGLQPAGS